MLPPYLLVLSFLSRVLSEQLTFSASSSLLGCLKGHELAFVTPEYGYDYEKKRQTWQARDQTRSPANLASNEAQSLTEFQPAAIVFPRDDTQVSKAIQCAAKAGKKVSARSGGHSFAGFSLGGQDGSVVIDLAYTAGEIELRDDGVAIIGAGNRLGPTSIMLFKLGKRAMTVGGCPHIGIGGILSLGGYGNFHRLWGLAIDSIVGHEVVLANGTRLHTSKDNHKDLFWALRGAAPSFGIITRFYVQTHLAPSETVVFRYHYRVDATQAAAAVMTLQRWVNEGNAISAFGAITFVASSEDAQDSEIFTLVLDGAFHGSVELFESYSASLLAGLPIPHHKQVDAGLTVIDALSETADPAGLRLDLGGYKDRPDARTALFKKHLVISADLSEAALVEAFTVWQLNAARLSTLRASSSFFIDPIGGIGSRISEVPADETSWPHRDVKWLPWISYGQDEVEPHLPSFAYDFVDGVIDPLKRSLKSEDYGYYLAYPETISLRQEDDYRMRYYAKHYERLQHIKREVDPGDVFSYPFGVTVSD